jgi:hypothetical protein
VIDFQPISTLPATEVARTHFPHLPAVKELMIHVHQVFVHESVVAALLPSKMPGLERRVCG